MQVRLACMGTDGDLLRAARERAGLTQGELADLVGAHRASVGNWENGTPPRNRLGKIREVLGLSSMDNSELVARLNVLMSQLNATASEVARRLSLTGEPKLGQITGDTDSNPPVTPRVVMDLGDDEMSALHDDDAGEVS
jgi:DNA-binding XRE family transcriptional regulator